MASFLPLSVSTAKQIQRSALDVIFPFYHGVSTQALPHTLHLYTLRNLAQFEADLDYLGRYFEAVKMSDFLEGKLSTSLKKPPMVLSFDDGLIQCYHEIMPVLIKKGIPATFFLNNDFIDNKDLFYRFKVSLLLEELREKSEAQRKQAASILQCSDAELQERLMNLSHPQGDLLDRVAEIWSFSFKDYLSSHPVYLSSSHILEMKEKGFEIGAHGFDHPHFSMIPAKESIKHIRQSIEDLQIRFKMDYKFFAFPFTDYGVKDDTIDDLFRLGIIDAGFGTAGMKEDKWKNYFQRLPMEAGGQDAKRTLRSELNRRTMRRMLGKNYTAR